MYKIVEVTGHLGGECYLILSKNGAVLYDTGFGFCSKKMADNLQAALAGRPLEAILLTHSHYDHAMGSLELKRRYPKVPVVCSEYAARVFQRPGAWKVMRSMDEGAAGDMGMPPAKEAFPPRADIVLGDGQELSLDSFTVRAIATPGHTHCSMSYYFPQVGLLATSETTGVSPRYPEILPSFLTGYRDTLDSIERCRVLGAKDLLIPHMGLLPRESTGEYFEKARAASETTANFVFGCLEKGLEGEDIVQAYRQEVYYKNYAFIQPERAFTVNTRAMVKMLTQEWEKKENDG